MDEAPAHLLAFSDSNQTLCGMKDRDHPLPIMLARFVQAHRDGAAKRGRTFEICADCYAEAMRRGLSLGERV